MTTYYIDFNGGNDANDGLSFANRKQSFDGLISENDNSSDNNNLPGNEYRVMGMPAVNTGVNATWTKGGFGNRDANNNDISQFNINGATAGTPISISTNNAHGFSTGDLVFVYNIRGIPAANGSWIITVTGTNTFTLNNSSGTGTYIGVGSDRVIQINNRGIKVNTGCKRIALSSGTTYTDNNTHNNNNNLYGVASSNVTVNRRGWFNGIHNLRIQIANAFGTGKAWYYTLPETLDLSDYQKISFHYQNRSDTRPNTSHLSLKLCTDTTGDVAAHTVQIAGIGSRGRYPIVEDFGTNLNSAIKSVALYVDSDVGNEDLRFSNIIAVKDANDGVTHCDVIGKNTTAEPVWWQCSYIQEDHMLFGQAASPNNDDFAAINSDRTSSYTHQSETVALHKVTPFNIYRNGQDHDNAGYAHKFQIRLRYDGRKSTDRVKVLGGWNTTDMSTQDSVTWINSTYYNNTWIFNANNSNAAYFDVEKFGMCGGGRVVHLRGRHFTVKDIYDGSCVPVIYGCTDPTAFNYNPDANTENGSCVEVIYGCTNPESVNYDPNANTDNGTCIEPVVGCTDPASYNYDPNANVSDPEACLYDAGCITGPGEPYWLNDQCYAWVIDVDNYCCDNDWDPVCQEMYNYCENGWPDGFDINGMFNRSFNSIVVYPNPTDDILNIGTTLDVTYSLTDVTGRTIINNSSKKTVDMSGLESGVYFLTINFDGQVFNKRIIKQ